MSTCTIYKATAKHMAPSWGEMELEPIMVCCENQFRSKDDAYYVTQRFWAEHPELGCGHSLKDPDHAVRQLLIASGFAAHTIRLQRSDVAWTQNRPEVNDYLREAQGWWKPGRHIVDHGGAI